MYEIVRSVIQNGTYDLKEILGKIDTLWVQGSLTDGERQELISMANQKADPENSRAPFQDQINTLFANVAEITSSLEEIKRRVDILEGGEPPVDPPTEEYPTWYRWEGIGAIPWQKDSKCSHNGKKWISHVADNIWEPGAAGVYETIWEEVEQSESEQK